MYSYLYLTYEQVTAIHDYILKISWGLAWIVKEWVLQSTLDFVKNDDYYPSFAEKVAYLMYSIAMNHCFADGNKRTALTSCAQFILFNTNDKQMTSDFMKEFENMVVRVADGSLSKNTLTEYIATFLNKYEDRESVLLRVYKELHEHNLV